MTLAWTGYTAVMLLLTIITSVIIGRAIILNKRDEPESIIAVVSTCIAWAFWINYFIY